MTPAPVAAGDTLFDELTGLLTALLGVEIALVAKVDPQEPGMLQVLSMHRDGGHVRGRRYPLRGGPCEWVLHEGQRTVAERLQERYPEDDGARALCVESYSGLRMMSRDGSPLGVVAVMSRRPLRDPVQLEATLSVFAGRAAAEVDRLRIEEAIDQSRSSYRAIFDASDNAILILDWDTAAILDVNRQACESYGYTAQEMRGFRAGDLSGGEPFTREQARRYVELAREGRCPTFEWRRRSKDGRLYWDEVNVRPAVLGDRRVLLTFARDITDRKNAVEQLQLREEQYRQIFEASSDALFLWDDTMHVVDVNPAGLAMYRFSRDDIVGQGYAPQLPEDYVRERRAIVRRALAGESVAVETFSIRHDGTRFEAELRAMPFSHRGRPHALLAVRDITARRAAEAERRALEAQLRQAQKMEAVGQLTGGIAHDFNNILTSVIGYVVLGQERAEQLEDATLMRQLGQAHLAAQRARDLISQMLAFARRQKGDPRPLALTPLTRQTLRLLRSTLPTTITLDTRYVEAELPADEPWVVADPVQLEQILFNLCINARDAMQGVGGIAVRLGRRDAPDLKCASCHAPVDGARWVELSVSDTGTGIEPELLDRIFDPFFSTKAPGQGSGMGLAMVHGIVHDHGGHILVDTAAGKGSTFSVLLPAADPPGDAPPRERRAPSLVRGDLPGAQVLLVEDDPVVGDYLNEHLSSWGLNVTLVRDPVAALRWLASPPVDPQLLLTDLTMPGMTGLQLAREAHRLRPDLPVLLVTGNAGLVAEDELAASGISCALRKPVDPGVLRDSLISLLHPQ
ncbi:PAS domain S-box protein [Ramlibacter henchirensis]|uniref:histidine kinase n=1 Tax=Ramlibacter henchirensis TaxID=204072 RepID=A0A4Z0C621_9BURK|nr:PAS domain S-box protein [Ramlibacter henchirensis]TFZ05505.1 PAS domain S-box protein [Ramlibacter henchirensis]